MRGFIRLVIVSPSRRSRGSIVLGVASMVASSLFLAACVLDGVSPDGKPCPCPETFVCDAARNVCVDIASTVASTGTEGASSSSSGVAVCAGLCGTPGCSPCPTVAQIDGGLGYTIDAFEAVRGDYAAFLSDHVDPASQTLECKWNTSFDPKDMFVSDDTCDDYDLAASDMPATCLDWCDAKAFCIWAGKRLCGQIGGGALPMSGLNDAALGEWYAACSSGGANQFPYGNTHDDQKCSGGGGDALPPGLKTTCVGGFPGLYDMVGNVEEWEDGCDVSANPDGDECPLRGGAFWASHEGAEAWAQCPATGRTADRGRASHDWGFRCCDDL